MADCVDLKNVWEYYRMKFVVGGRPKWENFWALRDINFSVREGEVVGLIGENGAGKTTILKLIAGLLKPDRGSVYVKGKVCGLLEITAGFQPELTGEENIYLNASMFGFDREEIKKNFDKIVDFSGLGKFIYAPLKYYSQGMLVRLAFSTAIHTDPDILLIDDTFSVGDEDFQRRSLKRIFELKDEGKTIIFVTHNMSLAASFSKRGIFLRRGRILQDGPMHNIISYYMQTFGRQEGIGILENGPLRVVFNNGKLSLNYNAQPLTKGFGIYSAFKHNEQLYDSTQLEWEPVERDDTHLIFSGRSVFSPVALKWEVSIPDKEGLKFKVEYTAGAKDARIQEHYMDFMLSNKYDKWKSDFQEGFFPEIFARNLGKTQGSAENLEAGAVGSYSQDRGSEIPAIIIKNLGNEKAGVRFLNSGHQFLARIISWQEFASGASYSFQVGLGEDNFKKYFSAKEEANVLHNGDLRLEIKAKKVKIFYKDNEFATIDGLSSSVQIDGVWFDAKEADWQIQKMADAIGLILKYQRIPLQEKWSIKAQGDKVLISMGILKEGDIELGLHRLRFILPPSYIRWFTRQEDGVCPDLFYSHRSVDCLQRSVEGDIIGLAQEEDKELPSAIFKFNDNELGNSAKLYNASLPEKARVVEIFKTFPDAG